MLFRSERNLPRIQSCISSFPPTPLLPPTILSPKLLLLALVARTIRASHTARPHLSSPIHNLSSMAEYVNTRPKENVWDYPRYALLSTLCPWN